MRNQVRLTLAAATIVVLAAGGAAFTAANTQASGQVVGYGTTSITGATVNSMKYNLNATGDNIDSVTLVLAGDTTTPPGAGTLVPVVSIGFNGAAVTDCGTGTFASNATTYTCDNGGGAHFVLATASLTSTAVVVN